MDSKNENNTKTRSFGKSMTISGVNFTKNEQSNRQKSITNNKEEKKSELKLIGIKTLAENLNKSNKNNNSKYNSGFNSNRAIINSNRNSTKNEITNSVFNDTKTANKFNIKNSSNLKDVYFNSNSQDYFLELKKKKLLSEKDLFESKKELLKDKIKEMIKGENNFINNGFSGNGVEEDSKYSFHISNEEINHIATSVVLHDEIKEKHKEKMNLRQFNNNSIFNKNQYQPKSQFNSRFYYVMKNKIDHMKEETINPYDPIFKKYIK